MGSDGPVCQRWTPVVGGAEDGVWTGFVVDTEGDLVWWHTRPGTAGGETGYARLRLSADNRSLWFAQTRNAGAPLYRVSVDTLEQQVYEEAIGSHDICAVSGSGMAYLDFGSGSCAIVVEIDETGAMKPVLDAKSLELDGCHINAVRYSASEDVYTVSSRTDDVLAVDREGQLLWRLSEEVELGNSAWGGQQHGTHLLTDRNERPEQLLPG